MSSLKTDTWYPKYPADYLKDTLFLTMEEDGFYNRALDQVYILRGRIPADPVRLQLLLRATPEQWERCRWILEKFFYRDGDAYGNERADKEIAKAQANAKIAQENGKKGGRKPGTNPEGTQPVTRPVIPQEPSDNPSGGRAANPEGTRNESSSPPPSPSPSDSSSPREEPARASVPGSLPGISLPPSPRPLVTQAHHDRAARVAKLYPAKAPKDGANLTFSLDALNALARKIADFPDYPWEDHAKLEDSPSNKTPLAGHNWVAGMPNPVALDRLRKATPAGPQKTYYTAEGRIPA